MKIQEGSPTCAAEPLPLFSPPGSHTPNIDPDVTNIEAFNCVISADFPPPPDVFSDCLLVLKITAYLFLFPFFFPAPGRRCS